MAPIKIHVSTSLQHFTDNLQTIEVNGETVGECLNNLIERFPNTKEIISMKEKNISGFILVYLNKERDFAQNFEKSLTDGDELTLLRKIVGG